MIVGFQFENKSNVFAYMLFYVQHHFEEMVICLIRAQQTFSIKGQIITILGFVSLCGNCYCSTIATTDNMQANGHGRFLRSFF